MKKTTKTTTPEAAKAAPAFPRKTADEICAFDDRPTFDVVVPEWETVITCRQPDALTMAKITESSMHNGVMDNVDFAAKLIMKCSVEPVFTAAHVEVLKTKSAAAFARVAAAIREGKKKEPQTS